MNRQIRRVAGAIAVLMLAILINLNYVQVIKADDYRNDPDNRRVILNEYSNPRGSITVQGSEIARSVPTNDELKYLRKYPNGRLYAPVTGFYSLIYGSTGIEQTNDGILAGTDSRLLRSRITDLLTGRNPKGGRVDLTLSKAAQEAAYSGMAHHQRGAVVALDPTTGAILAAVSLPSFDPNKLSSHDANAIIAAHKKLYNDPNQPTLNRAFFNTYPPGSTFKVVVAAAALKAGHKPSTEIPAPDVLRLPGTASATLQNFGGERCGNGKTDTLIHALTISCNTAFAQLAIDLGEGSIRETAANFGIDDQPRTVPLDVLPSTLGDIVDQASLAQSAIGQRDVRITPLEGAMMASAVADGGVLMKPYLVKQELAPDLSVVSKTDPQRLSTVLDPEQNSELVQMMTNVVANGTGTSAQIQGITVAGKTGTADTTDAKGNPAPPDAWFIGFAPAERPKIAVAVVIENGGVAGNEITGGKAAAPIARDVMAAYLSSIGAR